MWTKTYSTTVKNMKPGKIWQVWADVNQWHTWQNDIEYAKLTGKFETGTTFEFKPKGGPKIDIQLTRVEPDAVFVDVTRFPLAKMYDAHELIPHGEDLEIRTTVSIRGPLSFVWKRLVAENVANGMQDQTERLIERARNV